MSHDVDKHSTAGQNFSPVSLDDTKDSFHDLHIPFK